MLITAKATTYEFSLEDIKNLITESLSLKQGEKASVDFVIEEVGGDPLDRFPGTKQVTKVRVKIEHVE